MDEIEIKKVSIREIARQQEMSIGELEIACGFKKDRLARIIRGEAQMKASELITIAEVTKTPIKQIEYQY